VRKARESAAILAHGARRPAGAGRVGAAVLVESALAVMSTPEVIVPAARGEARA
jgi:hypothetical protein